MVASVRNRVKDFYSRSLRPIASSNRADTFARMNCKQPSEHLAAAQDQLRNARNNLVRALKLLEPLKETRQEKADCRAIESADKQIIAIMMSVMQLRESIQDKRNQQTAAPLIEADAADIA